MTIPNADRAVIAKDKLCDYLLNLSHRRGGPKARLLLSMGYSADDWQLLEAAVRACHLTSDAVLVTDSDYGKRYELRLYLVAQVVARFAFAAFGKSILEPTIRD